jgi:hypothetical protein
MKRMMWIALGCLALLALAATAGLWLFLSSWVPVKGKALVIEELERRWPIDVSIQTMRYRLLGDLVLERLEAADRRSGEVWLAAPEMRVRVGWLRWWVSRQVAFRARVQLARPARTTLSLAGRYGVRDRALELDIKSTDLPLASLTPPATRVMPAALTDGVLRVSVHVSQRTDEPPVFAGEIDATSLTWTTPAWRLFADATVDGRATAPPAAGGRWSWQGRLELRHGGGEGLPVVGSLEGVEGRAMVDTERIDIERLTAKALDAAWAAEGTLTLEPRRSLELLVSSRLGLASAAAAFPEAVQGWHPAGMADVRAVCRGWLPEVPWLDCLLHADLADATLAGEQLAHPLTQLAGSLDADLLTRRIRLLQVAGRLADEPFTVSGEVTASQPPHLHDVVFVGTVPLEVLGPWLPAESPVTELGGRVHIDAVFRGPATAVRPTGLLDLLDARLRLTTPAFTIEEWRGPVRLEGERIHFLQTTLRVNGEPLTLSAAFVPGPTPSVEATLQTRQGEAQLVAVLTPDTLKVNRLQVSFPRTSLLLSGALPRDPAASSSISGTGRMDLAELTDLPFLPLPGLAAWKLQGTADVSGQLRGPLTDWTKTAFQVRVNAPQLRIRDVPLEAVVCTVEQSQGRLQLRVPAALLSGGRLTGELVVEHQGPTRNFLAQVEVAGLQLDGLKEAIPAWRDRAVSGTASAQALLSGTWEQRATWGGEGWLNASGEQLGDVPLLDKLFQRGLLGPLAEWLGWDVLRRAEIRQVALRWHLAQERIHTEDLRVVGVAGGVPVVQYGRGSVGLDQTVDLDMQPELSEQVIQQTRVLREAAAALRAPDALDALFRSVRYRVGGTIKEPQVRFERSLTEFVRQLLGSGLQGIIDLFR